MLTGERGGSGAYGTARRATGAGPAPTAACDPSGPVVVDREGEAKVGKSRGGEELAIGGRRERRIECARGVGWMESEVGRTSAPVTGRQGVRRASRRVQKFTCADSSDFSMCIAWEVKLGWYESGRMIPETRRS
jgi:hypothetical protein